MAIGRISQGMMINQSLNSIGMNSARLSTAQERMSTGRELNRPSDSPTATIAAMRLRADQAALAQHKSNAQDGLGWLNQIDASLSASTIEVRRARELAIRGANGGAQSNASREALAVEVEQIRDALISIANSKFMDRPVFGGITAGGLAYDPNGEWVGEAADVKRIIDTGVELKVNVNGNDVFGATGASVFDELTQLAADLRTGNVAGVQASIDTLGDRLNLIATTHAEVGVRAKRAEQTLTDLTSKELDLTAKLSDVEDADLVKTAIEVKLFEVGYQAAISTSARVLSTSLLDYLR